MSDEIASLLARLRPRGVDPAVGQRVQASVRDALAEPVPTKSTFWRYAGAVAVAGLLAVAMVTEDRQWRERLAHDAVDAAANGHGSDEHAAFVRVHAALRSHVGTPWNRLLYQL